MNQNQTQSKPADAEQKSGKGLDEMAYSVFRGPIERHQGTIRVRVDVQREGNEYWARVVADPIRPDAMPLAAGPTREHAIHAACEKASIPPNDEHMDPPTSISDQS
jgi:hypothetical protein